MPKIRTCKENGKYRKHSKYQNPEHICSDCGKELVSKDIHYEIKRCYCAVCFEKRYSM